MDSLNYRHLYYFWVVAKEGGFSRAADRLGMAVQSIGPPVRELERYIGFQLLKPVGRGVMLTDAGKAVYQQAEVIFHLGQSLLEQIRHGNNGPEIRLAVGLSDGISKLAAHELLGPVLRTPGLHLTCHEGEAEQLIAEVALHKLDLILAGQSAPLNPNLRLVSRRIAYSSVDWYGTATVIGRHARKNFPASLSQIPVLMPTGHSSLRTSLELWFESLGIKPRIVGEFEDSAMMMVFAARDLGVFPISRLGLHDLELVKGLQLLGATDVHEEVHAIYARRGGHHPLVRQIVGLSGDAGAGHGP